MESTPHDAEVQNRVQMQDLRDFTVQIRNAQNAPVGTGFVVSPDGKIVTCAHVVRETGFDPRAAGNQRVGIYFPKWPDQAKLQYAQVIACFSEHDDDVVLLQLIKSDTLPPWLEYARLGRAERSFGHDFRSYGFIWLKPYSSGWAVGEIVGDVDPPAGQVLRGDPVQLRSSEIDKGMSGAPVLDVAKDEQRNEPRNRIVGIISQTYYPDPKTLKGHQTAWAVNASVLSLAPFSLSVQDTPFPLREAPQPSSDLATARFIASANPGMKLYGAPPPLKTWVGRSELLQSLTNDWATPALFVTSLIGFGGEGKSSLARQWLDTLQQSSSRLQPDGVFWWNFYEQPDASRFFQKAFDYLRGEQALSKELKELVKEWADKPAQILGTLLRAGRYLFVLDGLEVMQYQEGDHYGSLKDDALREFLEYCAAPGHKSFCLVTSRVPLLDLINYTTYKQRDVDHLSNSEGCALLRQLGVFGPDAQLSRIVAMWEGWALGLTLIGTNLVEQHAGRVIDINNLPAPAKEDLQDERIGRILRWYDELLTDAECAFIMLLSAFRRSVDESAFAPVFRAKTNDLSKILSALDETTFTNLINHLINCQIVSHESETHLYTTHILIHTYYGKRLEALPETQIRQIHDTIAKYYRSRVSKASLLNPVRPVLSSKTSKERRKRLRVGAVTLLFGTAGLRGGVKELLKLLDESKEDDPFLQHLALEVYSAVLVAASIAGVIYLYNRPYDEFLIEARYHRKRAKGKAEN